MMIWIACAAFAVTLILWFWRWRDLAVSAVDGAIVMAFGILLTGAMQQMPVLRDATGPYLAVLLLAILCVLVAGYVRDVCQGTFRERHFQHPIASFATGTWVAALSVACVVIVKFLPGLRVLAVVLFAGNVLLWCAYLILVVRNYWTILRNRALVSQTHGVLLLACVTTQSIVVAGEAVLGSAFPVLLSRILIVLGLVLYLFGAVLIAWRYLKFRPWNLADHWTNTNCILHGALSITGLACTVSRAMPPEAGRMLWGCVFVLFLLVEGAEAVRAVRRIKVYGWNAGLLTYANTQWARNFTFGMWLAFTMNLSFDGQIESVRQAVLLVGPFVVVGLFLIEVAIFIKKAYYDRRNSVRNVQDSISA